MKLAILLVSYLVMTAITAAPIERDTWNQYLTLKKDVFVLFWNFSDTDITFRVHAKTTGWLGFGVSPNGGMTGADVIMAWHLPNEGRTVLTDRHAVGKMRPIIDAQQDWHLIDGREEAGWTIVTFTRKVDTCDAKEDMVLRPVETQRLIWAMAADGQDPQGEPDYHSSNRGTFSYQLLTPPPNERPLPPDAFPLDITMHNYRIPHEQKTVWWCKTIPLNQQLMQQKSYGVKGQPIIQAGNEEFVHHMVIYACYDKKYLDPKYHGMEFNCFVGNNDPVETEIERNCNEAMFAWGVGGVNFTFPDHVGFPIGGPNSRITMFRLEMHYDNPQYKPNVVDSSGLRVWMTKIAPKYESWTMGASANPNTWLTIPPNSVNYHAYGYCHQDCLHDVIKNAPGGRIQVFGLFFHTHLVGRKIRLRHFRQDKEIEPIAIDDAYDFNYQDFRLLPEEVTVLPGDGFVVECMYDTTSRSEPTFGGLSTTDEMCSVLMMIYPRVEVPICVSNVDVSQSAAAVGGQLDETFQYFVSPPKYQGMTWEQVARLQDWTPELKERYQKMTAWPGARVLGLCLNNNGTSSWRNHSNILTPLTLPPVKSVEVVNPSCQSGASPIYFQLFSTVTFSVAIAITYVLV